MPNGRAPASGAGARRRKMNVRMPLLLTIVLLAMVLYFAREVLIPIALAILLTFLLAPVVRRLEQWRVPRVVGAVLAAGMATVAVSGLVWLVRNQVVTLAEELPQYKDNIATKMRALRPLARSPVTEAGKAINELSAEIAKPIPGEPGPAEPAKQDEKPQAVRVVSLPPSPIESASAMVSPLIKPLTTAGIVLVFTMFMLMRREALRDKVIKLIGENEVHATTPAIDEVGERVGRYLAMQTFCNALTGGLIGLGLWALGVPNAALAGFMIAFLRFAPYIGVWVGAAIPVVISLATSEGWWQPGLVILLVVGVEVLIASFIEPLLVGTRTGLSPLAVLIAAVFWSWLWGAVGLLLAVPLTVCLAVLGRHVRRLQFLDVLLGDEPALDPEMRLYQRLLADDHEESAQIVEELAGERTAAEVVDQLFLPALRLAEADRHRGDLDEERSERVLAGLGMVADDWFEKRGEGGLGAGGAADGAAPPAEVMIVPARDAADELAGRWLLHLLESEGTRGDVLSSNRLMGEVLADIQKRETAVVCVSAVPPDASVHARVMCRRLHSRLPQVRLVTGVWNGTKDAPAAKGQLGETPTDHVLTTMTEAVERLRAMRTPAVVTVAGRATVTRT
jgi:predicted PurR-regulated permease PerM